MAGGSFYFRDNAAFNGASPQAIYEELWERGRRQRLVQRGIVAGLVLLLGAKLLSPVWGLLLALLSAGLVMAWQWWARAMHTVWLHGQRGERRTARILRFTVERRGHRVLHGRAVPGYGNLDQLLIGPSGVWAISNQSWQPDAEFGLYGGKLFVGREAGAPEISRLREAAETISRLLAERLGDDAHIPVAPLLTVYGGKLPKASLVSEGVTLTRSYLLPRVIRRGPRLNGRPVGADRLTPEQIEVLTQAAIHALPIGDHTMAAR